MLDTQTKRRIDDCRDILVGKLPDPKAQIEQITIALIYKFMDDMDKEAIELGGQAKFFSDYKTPDPQFPDDRNKDILVEFSKYSWDSLMHPKVTAAELLKLYMEAIEGMNKNPNIPQLFRDIFNNAYLPYRDPETLKLFLKTIGEFEYTHSEKLGDAFEYLLSIMGSQGDAGQFRTPRHIIDFLVSIVNPDKTDSILDPACGTAGFLISAYKHILLKNSKENKKEIDFAVETQCIASQPQSPPQSPQYNIYSYNKLEEKPFNNLGDLLTPDERKRLIKNFVGYDISPDMVRLSLVNLYLHGFNTPNIYEYDTLSSEDRWNDSFDVVLANPPFMSPKGGIRPHKKFTINSNRSEVLFVDYIAEHLNPKGRAGIIVPEGIIFQSGKAYKDLRKMLVENYLYAVVSLPAGVFNPYSGVKTSILLMDKQLAKQKEEILFIKIDNDGYNLGAQRTPIKGEQLSQAIEIIHKFIETGELEETPIAHLVSKPEIAKNGEYNLSGERYIKNNISRFSDFDFIDLAKLEKDGKIEFLRGQGISKKDFIEDGKFKTIHYGDLYTKYNIIIDEVNQYTNSDSKIKSKIGDVLVPATTTADALGISIARAININNVILGGDINIIRTNNTYVNSIYLAYLISYPPLKITLSKYAKGTNILHLSNNDLRQLEIPLPPLSIQEEIVAEIEAYQKIIDGAKAIVENYKPHIDIDPDWEMVELGEVCKFVRGPFGGSLKKEIFVSEGYAVYEQSHAIYNQFSDFRYFVDTNKFNEMKRFEVFPDDLIMSCSGTMGKVSLVPQNAPKGIINQALLKLTTKKEKLINFYLKLWMESDNFQKLLHSNVHGAAIVNVASVQTLKALKIPLPNIETQRQIVSKIEKEQELVNANKQLIEIFEQKIKDRIAKVWGE